MLAVLALLVSGCETISRGTEQTVVIETKPAGADVILSDGQRCVSPCRFVAPRYRSLSASISKQGCRSEKRRLSPSVTEETIPLGEISGTTLEISPIFYRTVYDYQLGGAYDIEPAPLVVTLTCGEAARQQPPSLTARDEAVLSQFNQVIRQEIGNDLPPLDPSFR